MRGGCPGYSGAESCGLSGLLGCFENLEEQRAHTEITR